MSKALLSMNRNKAKRDVKPLKIIIRNIILGVMGIITGRATSDVGSEKFKILYNVRICCIRI